MTTSPSTAYNSDLQYNSYDRNLNAAVMATDIPERSETLAECAPAWLDSSLFQRALRAASEEDADVCVQAVHVSRAIAPGENFSSVIYRARVKLTHRAEERSLLIKKFPEGEAMIKSLQETGLFAFETAMLTKYIPKMKSLLERVAPGPFPPLAARCLFHGSSPAPFIVLEDLKPLGFRLAERRRGLGLRHSLMALRTLARFHAASAALLAEDPSIANDFWNPFRSSTGSWGPYISSVIQLSADLCRKLPGYEDYAPILETIKPKAYDVLADLNDASADRFNVLLHGDFWTNNVMFKYNEDGQVRDIRMVDLQIAHVSSPTIDLLYFLYTSLSDDVSEQHESLLIREYHVALSETLNYFGIPGPSFKELMDDINDHGFYGVFAAVSTWFIAHSQAVPDINASFEGDTKSINCMYEGSHAKQWLQRVLPLFKNRGWLNV